MTSEIESKAVERLEVQPMDLVAASFPEKDGLKRRIAHLWGRYYRVNYHSPERQNIIVESHFIQVRDNKVIESN